MNTKKRWQILAPEYLEALSRKDTGDYLRYRLLTPHLMKILGPIQGRTVLDVGCGDGYLARKMARKGAAVWAFDWMEALIARAKEEERRIPLGIHYEVADASVQFPYSRTFDIVVANMVLKDMPRIETTIREVFRLLDNNGRFIASVLHPCFFMNQSQWRARKNITAANPTVSYALDRSYASPAFFLKTVSGSTSEIVHFHRPVSWYVRRLTRSGFLLSGLWEPVLKPGRGYPDRYHYATLIPPFLIMEWIPHRP